jgi:polysaccharide biosynthesis/export protein
MVLKNYYKIILLFFSFCIVSCGSKKKIVYLQNVDSPGNTAKNINYEPKLQYDDMLSIIVSAEQPELTIPFNQPQIQGNYELNNNQDGIKTYLIDSYGFIDFPVIGKLKLAGLSRSESITLLQNAIKDYIKNPNVNIRILNFKISVLGEVNKPGNYKISSERITLLEALSLAGDLTIFGKRNNILIIREVEGKKSFNRIDITKSDFINTEYYYLTQNDVIIIEPNATKVNSSVIGPNTGVILSSVSLLVSIFFILTRN